MQLCFEITWDEQLEKFKLHASSITTFLTHEDLFRSAATRVLIGSEKIDDRHFVPLIDNHNIKCV